MKKKITIPDSLSRLLAIVIISIGLSIAAPNFLTVNNILNIFNQASMNVFIAIGMMMTMLIAGIAGVQAKNRSLCNVCGIIILISAIITFLGNVGGDWSLDSIISALISVVLPVLYYIGVKKAF